MEIYEGWGIFRKMLKRDLALDEMSSRCVWRYLVGVDEIARPSSFSNCHHGGGRGCHGTVLCGDHHCDATCDRSE